MDQAAALEIEQQVTPRLRALTDAIGEANVVELQFHTLKREYRAARRRHSHHHGDGENQDGASTSFAAVP